MDDELRPRSESRTVGLSVDQQWVNGCGALTIGRCDRGVYGMCKIPKALAIPGGHVRIKTAFKTASITWSKIDPGRATFTSADRFTGDDCFIARWPW